MRARSSSRQYALVLGVLAVLFLLRVLGQMLVAFAGVTFLPSMPEWYSGLLPYPILLPVQWLILLVQLGISVDLWRDAGVFATRRPRLGRLLHWFSLVYFAVMVTRYVVTMTLYPERRWLGTGTIPIVFHWVLAAYLFVLGRFHTRAA